MKYSALIRKLIQASEESRTLHSDVADRLKYRCVEGIDIVRQMLMNAVCDPRFRMHVSAVPYWRQQAQERLETFAQKMLSARGLTEGTAFSMMDEMLSEWFEDIVVQIDRRKSELYFPSISQKHSKASIQKALTDFVQGEPGAESQEGDGLSWTGRPTVDPLGYFCQGEIDENDKEGADKPNDERRTGMLAPGCDSRNRQVYQGIGGSQGYDFQLENRFLSNVPPSLIELARRIGRSASQDGADDGRFMKASKSDIAGVTTGNDLSCMLPSELALMAGKETENIFFKNYVTRSLQLFSSVSQSGKSKKHREGPIIICLDTSGSMMGEPVIVAKALTVAICIIAQRKKRKVAVVKYSYTHEAFFVNHLGAQRREMLDFLSHSEMGGNNENELFRWLFTELLTIQGDWQYGDILCISDFGWTPVVKSTMELIREAKKKNMRFYGLNIRNGEDTFNMQQIRKEMMTEHDESEWGTPETICDSLWEYRDGRCWEVTK